MIESETIQNLRGPVDHMNPVPLNGGFGRPLKLRVYHNRDGLFYLSHMLRRGFKILLNCVVPVNHLRSSADLRKRRVMPCAEALGKLRIESFDSPTALSLSSLNNQQSTSASSRPRRRNCRAAYVMGE